MTAVSAELKGSELARRTAVSTPRVWSSILNGTAIMLRVVLPKAASMEGECRWWESTVSTRMVSDVASTRLMMPETSGWRLPAISGSNGLNAASSTASPGHNHHKVPPSAAMDLSASAKRPDISGLTNSRASDGLSISNERFMQSASLAPMPSISGCFTTTVPKPSERLRSRAKNSRACAFRHIRHVIPSRSPRLKPPSASCRSFSISGTSKGSAALPRRIDGFRLQGSLEKINVGVRCRNPQPPWTASSGSKSSPL